MTSPLSASTGGGTYNGSAHGCFFGISLSNFSGAPTPSPSTPSLNVNFGADAGNMTASNTTTGPTQSVYLGGNQINAGATFAYDLF